MGYRVTDPDKWHKDKWFRKLKPLEKLTFLYLTDNCNIGGFWEKDLDMMAYSIGAPEEDLKGALKGLHPKVIVRDEWVWVVNAIKHQKNLPINPQNNAHKGIINRLDEQAKRFAGSEIFTRFLIDNGLKEILVEAKNKGADKGLNSPIGKSKSKGKGSIDKEDKNFSGDGQAEIPDLKAFKNYGNQIGMVPDYCQHIYDSLLSRGWRDGRNDNPVRDWRAYLRMKFKYQHSWLSNQDQADKPKPKAQVVN